jgi:AmiR/NasT family two-component response regulator
MERHRLDERHAFEMLRQQARSQRRPLEDCSQDLVEGRAIPRAGPRQPK